MMVARLNAGISGAPTNVGGDRRLSEENMPWPSQSTPWRGLSYSFPALLICRLFQRQLWQVWVPHYPLGLKVGGQTFLSLITEFPVSLKALKVLHHIHTLHTPEYTSGALLTHLSYGLLPRRSEFKYSGLKLSPMDIWGRLMSQGLSGSLRPSHLPSRRHTKPSLLSAGTVNCFGRKASKFGKDGFPSCGPHFRAHSCSPSWWMRPCFSSWLLKPQLITWSLSLFSSSSRLSSVLV